MSTPDEEYGSAGIMNDVPEKTQPGMSVVEGDEYVQHDAPKRRAHVCCGCCCDTRKAVFAVNIVSLCLYGLGLMRISAIAAASKQASQYDDDAVKNALNEVDGVMIGLSLALFLTGMTANAIAIYGASNFNKIAIIVGGLWYIFEVVRSIAFFDFSSAIMAAFFCYPHVVFYYEMKQGIMTRESYPQEKNCCECCG